MKHLAKAFLVVLWLASSAFAQQQVQPVAGVLTLNLVPGTSSFKVILSANVTSVLIQNPTPGTIISVIFTENATGGFTVTFGGNIATSCAITTSANATSTCQLQYDATSNTWNGIGGSNPSVSLPGPVFNVKDPKYGAIGDTQHITDGSTTGVGARNTVTSSTAHFATHAKVGQNIVCSISGNSVPGMPISQITAVTSDTVVTTNGTDAGAISNLRCIWWTPSATGDDTAAFQAAGAAATPIASSIDPNTGVTLGTPPGTVYCPPGGYAVKGRILNSIGTGSTTSISFKGDQGKNHCIIYVVPGITDPGDGFAVLVSSFNNVGFDMEDITIDGLNFGFPFTHAVVQCQSCTQFTMKRIKITNISASGAGNGTIDFKGSSNGTTEDILVQGGGNANGSDFACSFTGSANGIINRNMVCSNHGQNLIIDNGSQTPRSVAGDNGITFIGGLIDESANGNPAVINNGGLGNFHDITFMVGAGSNPTALTVDGTSRAYLSNVSCGVFGSTTGTTNCMSIASGGLVTATNSDLRGNDANNTAGVAVNGPAGATFVDVGGNKILHSISGVISPVTAAQFTTLGFTGGIVPTTALTHTYPQPFLPALPASGTALSIVAFTPSNSITVKNFTITAGNTPTCATPPTFQISNGTQNFTQTFASAAQISGPFTPALTLFPAGTQVTLSITTAAYACATPPTNMNWSIEWESSNSF